jgi:hypothetical protein
MDGMMAGFQACRNLPFQNQGFVKTEHWPGIALAWHHAI